MYDFYVCLSKFDVFVCFDVCRVFVVVECGLFILSGCCIRVRGMDVWDVEIF